MSRRLLTYRSNKVLNALWEDGRILECSADDAEPALLGRIYVARVEHIVKNIQGAFLTTGDRKLFFSLRETPGPFFTHRQRAGQLTAGDEVVVQIAREPIKTKEAAAEGALQIPGRYCIILRGAKAAVNVSFSRKIQDENWKKEIEESIRNHPQVQEAFQILKLLSEGVTILIRTNAYDVTAGFVFQEVCSSLSGYVSMLQTAACKSTGTLLWKPPPPFISSIRDTPLKGLEEIVCDDPALLEQVQKELSDNHADEGLSFRLYKDSYPLSKCYSLETALQSALQKQVWLSSGAYLVIEQTEALTAIDVNTGKSIAMNPKTQEEYFYKINLEAAKEIMHQIRLRNLSGMILVDFINLQSNDGQESLLEELRRLALRDPVHTRIVDITKLGLVEITRKKLREPLDKQMNE